MGLNRKQATSDTAMCYVGKLKLFEIRICTHTFLLAFCNESFFKYLHTLEFQIHTRIGRIFLQFGVCKKGSTISGIF